MPMKRRPDKSLKRDEMRLLQLLDGPDACLFAGEGYFAIHKAGTFAALNIEQRDEVLAAMRDDWPRYFGAVMDANAARERLNSDARPPWALAEFGSPADAT